MGTREDHDHGFTFSRRWGITRLRRLRFFGTWQNVRQRGATSPMNIPLKFQELAIYVSCLQCDSDRRSRFFPPRQPTFFFSID